LKLLPGNIYHLYNRGNNKQNIFFKRENYIFFLKKTRRFLRLNTEIMAYCLMPNHFHFLIFTQKDFSSLIFGNALKTMLSSYSQAINIQEKRTGSLFQQNTKAKCLTHEGRKNSPIYGLICFNYIHQNPVIGWLVKRLEDWEFSSFKDYIELRKGTLCSKEFTRKVLDLPESNSAFYDISNTYIKSKLTERIS